MRRKNSPAIINKTNKYPKPNQFLGWRNIRATERQVRLDCLVLLALLGGSACAEKMFSFLQRMAEGILWTDIE